MQQTTPRHEEPGDLLIVLKCTGRHSLKVIGYKNGRGGAWHVSPLLITTDNTTTVVTERLSVSECRGEYLFTRAHWGEDREEEEKFRWRDNTERHEAIVSR